MVLKHMPLVALLGVFAIGGAVAGQAPQSTATTPANDTAATSYGSWGFDLTGMDRSVKPGDDWFRFVNGAWADRTQIPPDRSSYGAFAVLRDISEQRLRSLIGGYSATDTAHPDRMK
ncbi:MAG TPA: peptidase M13, partial [Sphingomicrobium sp.]